MLAFALHCMPLHCIALHCRRVLGCPPPVVLQIHRDITRQRRTLTAGTRCDTDDVHPFALIPTPSVTLLFERPNLIMVYNLSGRRRYSRYYGNVISPLTDMLLECLCVCMLSLLL